MKQHIREILGLPITEPVEYWDRYWRHFTEALAAKDNFNTVIDSPRFVIENIISEIEYNDLKNRDNRELFKCQLSTWLKSDKVFEELFRSKVGLLLSKMGNNDCPIYLLTICRQILKEIEKGAYFDKLISYLIKTIEDTTVINYDSKKNINKYTELIVAEFIASGFSVRDIRSITRDIKDMAIADSGDIIFTPDTYMELSKADYADTDLYHEAIKERIKNRTVKERVSVLIDYYYEEPEDCYVLIRLEGIKGDIDCMIDDINIYSPHIKRHLTKESTLSKIEQVVPDRKFINAAVPVKHKTFNSSIAYATQKLGKIIDLLALTFHTSEPIRYSESNIAIVKDGVLISEKGIGSRDTDVELKHRDFVKYMSYLDITSDDSCLAKIGERISFINNSESKDTTKLSTASHWFQKGKYSQSPEDRLLFHWIAIESVLKTDISVYSNITGKNDASLLMAVQKITAAIMVKSHFFNDCYDTYLHINHLTENEDNYLDIPEQIINNASLNMKAGDKVNVGKFLNNINEIESNINDEITKTELRELSLFYRDENGIKAKHNEIANDVILIYRLRNLIAHNAVYPKYLIDIYANKAEVISIVILRYLIDTHRKSTMGIDEILINTASDYDEFVQNIGTEIIRLKS